MFYLCNAFSMNMLSEAYSNFDVRIEKIFTSMAREIASNAVSAVGHADTAAVFGEILGLPVATNRISLTIEPSDLVLLGQYKGPRLPEGATSLPEGARIDWFLIKVYCD